MHADAVVVGAGVIGSSVAHALTRNGDRVVAPSPANAHSSCTVVG